MKNKLKDCIRKHVDLQAKELEDIISLFKAKDLDSGDLFSEPGKTCRQMAFIHTGVLRMYNITEEKEVTLWIGSEGSFITDLSSFINQSPARWFIEAVRPSRLLLISRENHFALLKKNPAWLEFDNQLLINAFTTLEQRMFSHLYMSAEERYQSLMEHEPAIFNRVPLKQIASMLGMTPETLSRLRNKSSHS